MRTLLLLIATTTAALTLAASSGASGDALHYTFTFGPTTRIDTRLCSFPVAVTLDGEVDGLITPNGREIQVIVRTTTFSANERSASGTSPHIDLFTGSSQVTIGLNFRVVLPGTGVLALDAGRIVVDGTGVVFEAGQHDIVNSDAAALCTYLSGE